MKKSLKNSRSRADKDVKKAAGNAENAAAEKAEKKAEKARQKSEKAEKKAEKKAKGEGGKRFLLVPPMCILLAVLFLVSLVRGSVGLNVDNVEGGDAVLLDASEVYALEKDTDSGQCLIIYDSREKECTTLEDILEYILDSMLIGCTVCDISGGALPDLAQYDKIIVNFFNFTGVDAVYLELFDWLDETGGTLFFAHSLDINSSYKTFQDRFGLKSVNPEYIDAYGLKINTDFMIGGSGFEYEFMEESVIEIPDIRLDGGAVSHVESLQGAPILWENTQDGGGRLIASTLSLLEKTSRGYFAAAICLMFDTVAYPVINAFQVFIDDFPSVSQIDNNYNEYIYADYHCNISSYYMSVWWPDIVALAKQFGLKYTAGFIITYNDITKTPFEGINLQAEDKFRLYGDMLLSLGGEICYHGYNHMPLAMSNFDIDESLGYVYWESEEDMVEAFSLLVQAEKDIFEGNEAIAYIPPSNIISEEGLAVLKKNFPEIKIYCSLYVEEPSVYVQEFGSQPDGTINFPRVTSGYSPNIYEQWIALNSLNFRLVVSHFIHPGDALDVGRSALTGWAQAYKDVQEFFGWLTDAAPAMERTTISKAAANLQRYESITSLKQGYNEDGTQYIIELGNFTDYCSLVIRFNNGATPVSITGGEIEPCDSGGAYLINAQSDRIVINLG